MSTRAPVSVEPPHSAAVRYQLTGGHVATPRAASAVGSRCRRPQPSRRPRLRRRPAILSQTTPLLSRFFLFSSPPFFARTRRAPLVCLSLFFLSVTPFQRNLPTYVHSTPTTLPITIARARSHARVLARAPLSSAIDVTHIHTNSTSVSSLIVSRCNCTASSAPRAST